MLVLTRRVGAKILIGSDIALELKAIRAGGNAEFEIVTPTQTYSVTRKIDGAFQIGEDITIELCNLSPCQARLGITAPRSVSVDREEVRARKSQENPGGRTKLSLSKRKS